MWADYNNIYEVSSDGHVRNKNTGRILHEFAGRDGYLRIQFDGKTRLVHRVVASLYIPNPDNLTEVNHIDGNKQNNRVNNLEWCTRNQNQKHAYKIGLKKMNGENNSRCRLKKEDVSFIRSVYKRGDKEFGATALSRKYNVAHQTICAVVYKQNWKELDEN